MPEAQCHHFSCDDVNTLVAECDLLRSQRDSLLKIAELLLHQYDASGDFVMGGKLTNEPFLRFRAAIAQVRGNESKQRPA